MRQILPGLFLLALASCAVLEPAQKPGFVVYFQERSAEIGPAARGTIAQAAAKAVASSATVTVIGWTDSAGSPQADVLLSELRARHVAEALTADGVPSSAILRRGSGQTGDDPGVASRRVNIEVGS